MIIPLAINKNRNLIFLLLSCFVLSTTLAFAYVNSRVSDTVEGTEIVTITHISTTGSWQAISIPSTIENVRHIALQVHNGTASDYTHIDNVVEFQISSTGSDDDFYYSTGITFAVGKGNSEVITYIKADTGQKIAILALR